MSYTYHKIRQGDTVRDEHRIIAESILHRRLDYNEIVHHVDGNARNNDADNLRVMSRSEHSRKHALEQWEQSRNLTIATA